MDVTSDKTPSDREGGRLLTTLVSLLGIQTTSLYEAMAQASDLLHAAISVEKVDILLYDPSSETLVAAGTSDTAVGRREAALGLDHIPRARMGQIAGVLWAGRSLLINQLDRHPDTLPLQQRELGIRSLMAAPLRVDAASQGIVLAVSAQEGRFAAEDLRFLEGVARWLGVVAHRAALLERLAALGAPPDEAAGEPVGWEDRLLQWRLHGVEVSMQEQGDIIARLEAAFSRTERELTSLQAQIGALTTIADQRQGEIQRERDLRAALEAQLRATAEEIVQLRARLANGSESPA